MNGLFFGDIHGSAPSFVVLNSSLLDKKTSVNADRLRPFVHGFAF
jgi:hypothetical protein